MLPEGFQYVECSACPLSLHPLVTRGKSGCGNSVHIEARQGHPNLSCIVGSKAPNHTSKEIKHLDVVGLLVILPLLVPLLTRFALYLRFRQYMNKDLPPKARDIEAHRTLILGLAGFSFAGLLGLAVADAALQDDLRLSVFFLLVSFLSYLWALNLQGYKFARWQDLFSDTLLDLASLALILSIVGIVFTTNTDTFFKTSITLFAVIVWGVDHALRVYYQAGAIKNAEERA